jgi:hypothetical protein
VPPFIFLHKLHNPVLPPYADKLQPRNINVRITNNSNVPIDVIIFTFYSDQLTIDVETGIVTKQ